MPEFDAAGLPITSKLRLVTITPTVLNADAYDAGDVLFDRTAITNATRAVNEGCYLDSLTILDKDDQAAAAMTLWFLNADVTLGTADAAVSISDTNAANLLGTVAIASGDWADAINSKFATKTGINLPVLPATGTRTIYVAATCAGTPTQTTGGIICRFWFKDPA